MGKIIPIILAGGLGKRLWPLSTTNHPKQFLKLFNKYSLFQQTLIRNKNFGKPTVIINIDHYEIALLQVAEIAIEVNFIIEPLYRNTGPAAIIAALNLYNNKEYFLLILACDHLIEGESEYIKAIDDAVDQIIDSLLVVVGVKPTSANINYGYVKVSEKIKKNTYYFTSFKEKPFLEQAQCYIKDESYFWNCGILLLRLDFFICTLQQIEPLLYSNCYEAFKNSIHIANEIRLHTSYYEKIRAISIDYVLLERITNINNMILVVGEFNWQDLGSWEVIWKIHQKNNSNNIIESIDISKYIIDSKEHQKYSEPAIILQGMKHIRSWGYYEILATSDLYKIKKLIIYPQQKISLQFHNYRSEHWVIIEGSAIAIVNGREIILSANDTIFIPVGVTHQLINNNILNLHLVEIQLGSYLEEDDIVRICLPEKI